MQIKLRANKVFNSKIFIEAPYYFIFDLFSIIVIVFKFMILETKVLGVCKCHLCCLLPLVCLWYRCAEAVDTIPFLDHVFLWPGLSLSSLHESVCTWLCTFVANLERKSQNVTSILQNKLIKSMKEYTVRCASSQILRHHSYVLCKIK